MHAIKTVVKNRQVTVQVPTDWPEGCEVLIEPMRVDADATMREEDWPTTTEGIAALLKRWDAHEPLEMTEQEDAEWEAAREAEKTREKAMFIEDADRLRRMWE